MCALQAECASAPKGPDPDLVAITRRMADIRHTILVLSGKGGVGKSTFAAQLAFALARQDKQVSRARSPCPKLVAAAQPTAACSVVKRTSSAAVIAAAVALLALCS